MKFRTGMAKCTEYVDLVQLVLDGEASRSQEVYLKRHLKMCLKCLEHYKLDQEIRKLVQLKLASKEVPEGLADTIRTKIAKSA
ncbi:MAG: zf-HC2 domain-containing protein [Reichenbachiella sp.]|uniref:zf-HC2 domain-containing protein n=2 Tax=Reichenbachiella sp. TaxID=2184521 RepID=UPI002965FF56|nr:zf-HC2 domain-containing protein [Reichenbachiella sp.]MDW3211856.1 zf-HC2 domain-containing protein [Reichenbachiella sp.]